MKLLILTGALIPLLLILFLLTKKPRHSGNKYLVLLLLLIAVAFFFVYLAEERENYVWTVFLVNYNLLLMPSLYFYTSSITTANFRFNYKKLFHFFFYCITTIIFLDYIDPMSDEEFIGFLEKPLWETDAGFIILIILDTLSVPVYIVLSALELRNFKFKLKEQYSSLEKIDYKWLTVLISALFISWFFIDIPLFIDQSLNLGNSENLISTSFSITSVIIIFMGYYGLKQTNVFITPIKEEQSIKYKKSGLENEELKIYYEKLQSLMKVKKIYLNNNLTLQELSEKMNLTLHNMSQVINECSGKGFYDFINSFRIRHFIESYKQNSEKSILSIALESGFNSKSAFNRAFKKEMNLTPSQFINSAKKQAS